MTVATDYGEVPPIPLLLAMNSSYSFLDDELQLESQR